MVERCWADVVVGGTDAGWLPSTKTDSKRQPLAYASWPDLGHPAVAATVAGVATAASTTAAATAAAAAAAVAATAATAAAAAAAAKVAEDETAHTQAVAALAITAAAVLTAVVAEPEWLARFSAGAPAAEVVQAWLGVMSPQATMPIVVHVTHRPLGSV